MDRPYPGAEQPAKFTIRVLDPIDLSERCGPDPDVNAFLYTA